VKAHAADMSIANTLAHPGLQLDSLGRWDRFMTINHRAYQFIKTHIEFYIDSHNRDACFRIMEENKERFEKAPGSTHNHQAWEGGYLDHILETMDIAYIILPTLKLTGRPVPKFGDVILCLFLHDIEKPWKYVLGQNELDDPDLNTKTDRHEFRRKLIQLYGFELTDEQWNGIEYAEGEIHNYSNHKRNMGPLAALVHMCDVWSARGWPEYPHG